MPDTTVKVFQNITGTDSGVPQLSGTAGALITVLDACLVNGYGSVTLDSLVVASNVATCTKSTGHGFTAIGTTGPVIRVSGSTPAGLNADWRITVVSSTVFTFVTTGISDQTATGTIDAKRAPAGFSKAFSGTDKAAYRSDDVTGTRLYLRVDDSGTTNARIRGYETMSDVDTGTGLYPTEAQISGGGYMWKSSSGIAQSWMLISDGQMVYFFDNANGANFIGGLFFGDIIPYMSMDAYRCALLCSSTASASTTLSQFNAAGGTYLARSYTQLGTAVGSARYSHGKTSALCAGGQSYPAPVDTGLHLWPVECWEETTLARGMMPGLWNPVHSGNSISHGTVVESIPQLPGRTFFIQQTTSYRAAFDVTGPWR